MRNEPLAINYSMTISNNVGSKVALIFGIPIGLTFSIFVLVVSLFPPIDIALAFTGGGLFWFPVVNCLIIPATFVYLLWKSGKRIHKHLDLNYSALKTSFLFTLYINLRLFLLLFLIFLFGGVFFTPEPKIISSQFLTAAIGFGLTATTFIIATLFTTFTIGLLIVTITKKRISKS